MKFLTVRRKWQVYIKGQDKYIQELTLMTINMYISLNLYNYKPAVAGCNYCNRLTAYIKLIRDSCLIKRILLHVLTRG
jgi:hypothetical protein